MITAYKESNARESSKAAETRKVKLGWMHSSSRGQRHVTLRATKGRVDFSVDATRGDIIAEGRKLFYPDNVSSHGSAIGMFFNIPNFKGVQIPGFPTIYFGKIYKQTSWYM